MIDGVISFVGVGSNLDDPRGRCQEAFDRMAAAENCALLRTSSLYRTEPVGVRDQGWFVNAVVELRTTLAVRNLLRTLQGIEADMGRVRAEKGAPRLIDLDILLYGQDVIREDDLVVPHPELHRRRFVLVPLTELAPYAIHPAFGISVKGLAERLEDGSIVELI